MAKETYDGALNEGSDLNAESRGASGILYRNNLIAAVLLSISAVVRFCWSTWRARVKTEFLDDVGFLCCRP